MSQVTTTVHESRSVVKSVSFSGSGFVEIELNEAGHGYIKVRLGEPRSNMQMDLNYMHIQHGNSKKVLKIARELRDALDTIIKSEE